LDHPPVRNRNTADITANSDDPWNQTAADNAEWLRRFKRQTGILTDETLPGLPDGYQWNISQGGSGFAPPYAVPNPNAVEAASFTTREGESADMIPISLRDGAKPFPAGYATAEKYLRSLASGRIAPPATVFCSRELENGLAEFVASEVLASTARGATDPFPSDTTVRAKACEILGTSTTAADDLVLLEKFKSLMKGRLGLQEDAVDSKAMDGIITNDQLATLPLNMEVPITDGELTDILQDMNFEFDVDGGFSNTTMMQ
jgi:hypothetical protein